MGSSFSLQKELYYNLVTSTKVGVELLRSTAEIRSSKKMSFSRLPGKMWRAGKLRVEVEGKKLLLFKGFLVFASSETEQFLTLPRCQTMIRVGGLLKRRKRTHN